MNDDTVCVLTNYRDIQKRELVVARNIIRSKQESNWDYYPIDPNIKSIDDTIVSNINQSDLKENNNDTLINEINNRYYSNAFIGDLSDLRMSVRNIIHSVSQCSNNYGINLSLDDEMLLLSNVFTTNPKSLQQNILFLYHLYKKNTIIDNKVEISSNSNDFIEIQIGNEEYLLRIFPVHQFIVSSRCQLLSRPCDNNTFNIYLNTDDKNPLQSFDLKELIPFNLGYVLPIVLDYLYCGNSAIDVFIIRYLCLSLFLSSELDELFRLVRQYSNIDYLNELNDKFLCICKDDRLWRYSFLSIRFTKVMTDLFSIGQQLLLTNFQVIIESILSKSIQISCYFEIYNISVSFKRNKLRNCCLKFFISHMELISSFYGDTLFTCILNDSIQHNENKYIIESINFNVRYETNEVLLLNIDGMLYDVVAVWNSFSVDVLSREGLRVRKLIMNSLPSTELVFPDCDLYQKYSYLFDIYECVLNNECKSNDPLSITDEFPFLYGSKDIPPSVCLPKYMNHSSCHTLNNLTIFIGGMNRERFHGFKKLLTYNTSTNYFKYVSCYGDNISSSHSNVSLSLTKNNSRYVIMFSIVSKKTEMSNKYSSLGISSVYDNKYRSIKKTNNPSIKKSFDELHSESYREVNNITDSEFVDCSGVVSILDCHTLTWFTPRINIDLSRNRFSSNAINSFNSMELKQSVFQAIKFRAGQSIVALYNEDLPYRCGTCMLGSELNMCQCGIYGSSHQNQNKSSFMIQFGGYCTKEQIIKSDVHLLIYSNLSDSDFSSPDTCLQLLTVRVSGPIPIPRFSHTAVILPSKYNNCDADSSDNMINRDVLVTSHTRMLVYGGISPDEHDMEELLSLRINRNREGESDFHWEHVIVNGPSPGVRHGHTMTYIDHQDIILMYGGVEHNRSAMNSDRVMSDIWCVSVQSLQWQRMNEFSICVRWEQINATGVPPSPRSRHSCTYNSANRLIYIFGGMEENLNDPEDPFDEGQTSLDESQKDFIALILEMKLNYTTSQSAYRANWINNGQTGRFIKFPCEAVIDVPYCSLSDDLARLMNNEAVINSVGPDLEFNFMNENVESDVETKVINCYSSLIAKRCEWVNAILLSAMKEATTMNISISNDYNSFSALLYYLCTDKLVLKDIRELCATIEVANQYNVVKLMSLCEYEFMRYCDDDDNIFELLMCADIFNLEFLHNACVSKLLRRNDIQSLNSGSRSGNVGTDVSLSYLELPVNIKVKIQGYSYATNHVYKL